MRLILKTLLYPLVGLTIVSCTNLKGVQTFSSDTQKVKDAFELYQTEFIDTCKMAKRYRFEDQHPHSLYSPEAALNACANRIKQAQLMSYYHKVIWAYADALGELASDEIVDFDPSLQRIGQGLGSVDSVDQAGIDAATRVVGFLLRFAVEGYRRNEIKEAIREADSDIQVILLAMRKITDDVYLDILLENEKAEMDRYYQNLLLRGKCNTLDTIPLDCIEIKNRWRTAMETIDNKRAKARAYLKAAMDIGKAHHQLYENLDNLSTEEISRIFFDESLDLIPIAGSNQ